MRRGTGGASLRSHGTKLSRCQPSNDSKELDTTLGPLFCVCGSVFSQRGPRHVLSINCSASCRRQSVPKRGPSYLDLSHRQGSFLLLPPPFFSASAPRSETRFPSVRPLFPCSYAPCLPSSSIGAIIWSICSLPSNPPNPAKSPNPIVPAALLPQQETTRLEPGDLVAGVFHPVSGRLLS
jgi:hypothetical protein